MTFFPDGQMIAVRALPGVVQFRNVKDGKPALREIRSKLETIFMDIALTDDGKQLAVLVAKTATTAVRSDAEKEVQVFNPKTRERLWALKCTNQGERLRFNPAGTMLAVRGWPSIELWDAKTGKVLRELKFPAAPWEMAFSPDGKWLAVATKSAICICDVSTGKVICSIPNDEVTWGLAFPRNHMVVVASARIVRVFQFTVKKK